MSILKIAALTGAILIGVAAIGFGVYTGATFYLDNKAHESDTVACDAVRGDVHMVIIKDNVATPEEIAAKRCDSLTIINQDDRQRRLAFGEHDHHSAYGGVEGKIVGKSEQLTVVLTEAGEFMVHDHFDDSVHAHFHVSK